MKRLNLLALLLIGSFFVSSAHAAAYIKFGGVEGETTEATSDPAPTQRLDSPDEEQPAALLLPAVQKVLANDPTRGQEEEAARKKKGNVEYGWKVEEGTK